MADRRATEHKGDEGRRDLHSIIPVEWAGGQWIWGEMNKAGECQVSWADEINDVLKNASWAMESKRYWQARRAGTPDRGTEEMEKPNWDDVVARTIVAKSARSVDSDVFRLQLWWDLLPSQARDVRQKPNGDNPRQCNFCSHKGPVGAWHIFSACREADIVETREATTAQIAAVIKEMVSDKAASKRLVGLL